MMMDGDDQRPLKPKLERAVDQLRYLPRTAALVWAASRNWTVAWAALLVAQGLLPVATVLLTREVVDAVVAAVNAGGSWTAVRALLWPAGALGGVLLAIELLGGIAGWIRTHQAQLIEDHIIGLIHDQSTAVDFAFYDSPDYYDHLHRARDESRHRPQKLVENAGAVVQHGVTLVAMAGVLLGFSAWIPLILVVSTLPALYVVLRHAVRQHRWRLKNTEDERRSWYYDWELTGDESAAEVRLFDLGDHFKRRFRGIRARLRRERLALHRAQSLSELGAAVVALLATAGCLAWMGWRTVRGELTLGELALFYAAFRQGQQMLRGLLGNIGDIYRNILFLGDLYEFLGLGSAVVDPPEPRPLADAGPPAVALERVGFAYPGARRPVLDGLDLTLPAGRITAIVGANGSGKSTVLKLICRLYDPTAGRIALDGVDLRELAVADLRRRITVLFQEPARFNATAGENIALGEADRDVPDGEVAVAADAAGAGTIAAQLPDGFATLLGRWFEGGTELSVGEWQRLALARAFLRRASLILLDEPTSAMDSWAEADWMARLAELVRGRTALIITHRFTTAMRADVIHVMEAGRIVESGSHEELLAAGGRYATSWSKQMQ